MLNEGWSEGPSGSIHEERGEGWNVRVGGSIHVQKRGKNTSVDVPFQFNTHQVHKIRSFHSSVVACIAEDYKDSQPRQHQVLKSVGIIQMLTSPLNNDRILRSIKYIYSYQ